MRQTTIGIDPGKTGAMAILDHTGQIINMTDLCDYYDGPLISGALLREAYLDMCMGMPETVGQVVIESVNSHGMGRQSAFNFGASWHALSAVAACLNMPVKMVSPSVWKKGLGRDKNASRAAAARRWPNSASKFARQKDDGRAEACLIAAWWLDSGRN